ncbi:MAG: YkgJ family cysteine cluster protein [Fibrobacterales bacterium]
MSYPKDIKPKLQNLLDSVPSLDCTGCWGDCCVCPTMTLVEFINMMLHGKELFGEEGLRNYILKPRIEHTIYVGNSHCRFQNMDHGRCEIYPGRALACRLHGHDALRVFESKEMVFCDRNPDVHKNLTNNKLEGMLTVIRELADKANIDYSEPYFMMSLNLEGWIDFYYQPELSERRPQLLNMYQFMRENLELPVLDKAPKHTTLAGKLKTIDTFFTALNGGDATLLVSLLNSLISDFPSSGSYFIDEAKQYKKVITEQFPELSE